MNTLVTPFRRAPPPIGVHIRPFRTSFVKPFFHRLLPNGSPARRKAGKKAETKTV
jgi:hypothetical protein